MKPCQVGGGWGGGSPMNCKTFRVGDMRLWPFKENKFLSIITIQTEKKKKMLTNTKYITET